MVLGSWKVLEIIVTKRVGTLFCYECMFAFVVLDLVLQY